MAAEEAGSDAVVILQNDELIAEWYFDKSGNPHAMAGLRLLAQDLAKFGQLILTKGIWEGQQLVS